MLLKEQHNKCKICAVELKSKYSIDHDHKTGKTRGILCCRCNLFMGAVDDDEWLIKGIQYRDSFR